MKRFVSGFLSARIVFFVAMIWTGIAYSQQFRLSDGLYRIPYSNGTEVEVYSDVWNHDPLGCMDIGGQNCSPLPCGIVAAAAGWIRDIRDSFAISCHPSLPAPNDYCCGEFNNYIILEHPNGEWSSYIHLAEGTITALGHEVDDWVEAGTLLGYEGSVGCSSGPHLHLEISRPDDPTDTQPWDPFDGVLRRDGELLNPVLCNVSGGIFIDGLTYTAGSCNDNCSTNLTISGNATNSVRRVDNTLTSSVAFVANGTGMYRAGSNVVLVPGFLAPQGVRFTARIKTCNQQN